MRYTLVALLGIMTVFNSYAQESKPASEATKAANQQVQNSLPFSNKQDFEDAQKGFIAKEEPLTIKDAKGNVVWDLEEYYLKLLMVSTKSEAMIYLILLLLKVKQVGSYLTL